MDYLIKKSDSSIVQHWRGTIGKITLPEQIGGDVVFTGDKRPLDLGDYILVEAIEVDEPLDATKKRGPTTEKVTKKTVTITRTAVAKTGDELAQEEINRLEAEITSHHMRSAILKTDDGWLASQQELIETERSKL
jgi:hypothetical protein